MNYRATASDSLRTLPRVAGRILTAQCTGQVVPVPVLAGEHRPLSLPGITMSDDIGDGVRLEIASHLL